MSAPDTVPGFESITPPDSLWVNAVAARVGLQIAALPAGPQRGEDRLPAADLRVRERLAGVDEGDREGRGRRAAGRARPLPDRPLRDLHRRVVRARRVAPGGVPGAPPQRDLHRLRERRRADGHGELDLAADALGELEHDLAACPCARATTCLPLRAIDGRLAGAVHGRRRSGRARAFTRSSFGGAGVWPCGWLSRRRRGAAAPGSAGPQSGSRPPGTTSARRSPRTPRSTAVDARPASPTRARRRSATSSAGRTRRRRSRAIWHSGAGGACQAVDGVELDRVEAAAGLVARAHRAAGAQRREPRAGARRARRRRSAANRQAPGDVSRSWNQRRERGCGWCPTAAGETCGTPPLIESNSSTSPVRRPARLLEEHRRAERGAVGGALVGDRRLRVVVADVGGVVVPAAHDPEPVGELRAVGRDAWCRTGRRRMTVPGLSVSSEFERRQRPADDVHPHHEVVAERVDVRRRGPRRATTPCEVADGLVDVDRDAAVVGLREAHRLDVRVDQRELARPVLAHRVAAAARGRPPMPFGQSTSGVHQRQRGLDVARVEGRVGALEQFHTADTYARSKSDPTVGPMRRTAAARIASPRVTRTEGTE